jgi:outer membrane protein assembly factor BamB
VTPTAGGVVFFGDMGGNFYALDANTGDKLWGQKIGGAASAAASSPTNLKDSNESPSPPA